MEKIKESNTLIFNPRELTDIFLDYTKLCHHPPRLTTIDHHQPPPTTSQSLSNTTHHHPPPCTNTHHKPKYVCHHTPPPKKWTTTPVKAKIYSYITSFWHCVNIFFFYEMQYFFPWRRFCVINFWSVFFSNSKFQLHFMIIKIFKAYISRL